MDAARLFSQRNTGFFLDALSNSSGLGLKAFWRLAKALRFQSAQSRKRALAARNGKTVPPILIASLTRSCNLDCAGCYSKTLRPEGNAVELSDDRFMEIFREAVSMGTGTIMLAGGEPLLRKGLVERVAALKGILVPVFTNGTLIDAEFADMAADSPLVPVFSIEGGMADTDGRRGPGVHTSALAGMALLRERKALFGASVTLTNANADSVLSDDYLSFLKTLGIKLLFLIEYVPVKPGSDNLVLTERQKELLDRVAFSKPGYNIVSLPGDEEAFGGCLAAGRGFIHLAPDGSIEACPFAPFSDTSVGTLSLEDALESPLMKTIRARHGELTETRGGCALWNKRGWIQSISGCAPEREREPA